MRSVYNKDGSPIGAAKVYSEWHTFDVFEAWVKRQDWKENLINCTLLVPGCTVYGPATCCFISRSVHGFLYQQAKRAADNFPRGIQWNDLTWLLIVFTSVNGKPKCVGTRRTIRAAFELWLECKQQEAQTVADNELDPRVKPAVIAYFDNYPAPDFKKHPKRVELVRYGRSAYNLYKSVV